MPSAPRPPLTQKELKQLAKLLAKFSDWIRSEQPMASDVIHMIRRWVTAEIEDDI